jgi:hypothetical protein
LDLIPNYFQETHHFFGTMTDTISASTVWDEITPSASEDSSESSSKTEICSSSKKNDGTVIRVRKEIPSQSLGIFLSRATSNGPLIVTRIFEGPFSNTKLSEGMELVMINGVACEGLSIFEAVQVCKEAPEDIAVVARIPLKETDIGEKAQLEQFSHLAYIQQQEQAITSIANLSVWMKRLKALIPMAITQTMKERYEDKSIPDLLTSKSDLSADTTIADSAFMIEDGIDIDQSLRKVPSTRSATSFASFKSLGRYEIGVVRLFERCGISILLEDDHDDYSQASRSASTRYSLAEKRARRRKKRKSKRSSSSKPRKTHRRTASPSSYTGEEWIPHRRSPDRRMLV